VDEYSFRDGGAPGGGAKEPDEGASSAGLEVSGSAMIAVLDILSPLGLSTTRGLGVYIEPSLVPLVELGDPPIGKWAGIGVDDHLGCLRSVFLS